MVNTRAAVKLCVIVLVFFIKRVATGAAGLLVLLSHPCKLILTGHSVSECALQPEPESLVRVVLALCRTFSTKLPLSVVKSLFEWLHHEIRPYQHNQILQV